MQYTMTANQTRVLGVLIEKSITTAEYYPLSLNALTNACNQKSSRDPVTSLSDTEVQSVCQNLQEKHIVIKESSSRTIKYKHRFFNTEFGELKLSDDQIAVVCVMMLRGNQSAGELKTRCQRLFEFKNNAEVEQTLQSLNEHKLGPFVKELSRESGKRDVRWMHLFVQNLNTDPSDAEEKQTTNIDENNTQTESNNSLQSVTQKNDEFDIVSEIKALKQEIATLKLQVNNIEQNNN
ncbi:MAG: YceH family protein [Saccharospirillaceae bacterium]|nr:YceH family protein [Pseudomonadales bacterium]NRB81334.1 YceH family protein [Saccharospirillaceae bacterium]